MVSADGRTSGLPERNRMMDIWEMWNEMQECSLPYRSFMVLDSDRLLS